MKYHYKEAVLNYEIIGEGMPIVMLHGFAFDMNFMKGCMEPIFQDLDKSYKRIFVDLLGMGKSTATLDYASSDKQLEVLISFLNEVVKDDFLLVGESYGGYLSLAILAKLKCRVKHTILICPMVNANVETRILPKKNYVGYDEAFLSTLSESERDGFTLFTIVANENTYKYYVEENVSGMNVADYTFLDKVFKHYALSYDFIQDLENDDKIGDVHFFCGKQDVCVGYEEQYQLTKKLTRSSFYLFDKAGHNLQLDQRALFHSILSSILK